jgi:hypothetical protein
MLPHHQHYHPLDGSMTGVVGSAVTGSISVGAGVSMGLSGLQRNRFCSQSSIRSATSPSSSPALSGGGCTAGAGNKNKFGAATTRGGAGAGVAAGRRAVTPSGVLGLNIKSLIPPPPSTAPPSSGSATTPGHVEAYGTYDIHTGKTEVILDIKFKMKQCTYWIPGKTDINCTKVLIMGR